MSKKYFCAKCGLKLKVVQKANPQKGTVMNLVIPHNCEETSPSNLDKDVQPKEFSTKGAFKILDKKSEKKIDKKIDKLFNDFPFVSRLNKATAEHETVVQESGDKRNKNHLREELVTSSAPLSVLDMAARSNATPAHDLEESEK